MEEDVEIEQLLRCNGKLLNEAVNSIVNNVDIVRPSTSKQHVNNSKRNEINYDEEVQELLDHQYINLSYVKAEYSEDENDLEGCDSTIKEIIGENELKRQNKQNQRSDIDKEVIEQLNSVKELILKKISFLLKFGEALQKELVENENKQIEIRNQINILDIKSNKFLHDINGNRCFFKKFGFPYFKDRNGFLSPINEDHRRKIKRKELHMTSLTTTSFWTKSDQLKLMDAIKDNIIQDKRNTLVKDINKLKEALLNVTHSEKEQLESKIIERQSELESLKKPSYSTLMSVEDPDRKFDWMKISYKFLTDLHSPEECCRYYNLFLKPTQNREFWKPHEDEALINLAEKNNFQDWDTISKELGTNRSSYHCFVRYQTQLQGDKRYYQGKWTKEEDDKLLTVVNSSLIGGFIPWSKISAHVTNRTHTQIYNRWRQSLNPKIVKGKFTLEEDVFIISGMQIFNSTYKELSYIMENRTSTQIRDRYERNLLKKKSKSGAWSLEEDQKLLNLVKTLGKSNWSLISKKIENRTRTQVRQRYAMILKLMESKSGWNIHTAKRQVSNNDYDKNVDTIKKKVEKIRKEFLEAETKLKPSVVEKETFRFESLKNLKNVLFAKKFKSKRKKQVLSDHSNGNNQLIEFFKYSATSIIRNSTYPAGSCVNQYFNDILLMAKYFQVIIKLPQSEDDIRNNSCLDKRLKTFLCDVIKETDLPTENLNDNKDNTTINPNNDINIDYIAPEFDDTILMNEWWHTSPIDVSKLNFSEFFKRTVFDYSNGMHYDIWTDKCKRVELPMYGTTQKPALESNLQKMYVNPNSFTLQGFRSILLSRARLKQTAVGRNLADNLDSSIANNQSQILLNVDPVELAKFQQTLLTLFTWPKALSLTNDQSILLAQFKNKPKYSNKMPYCYKTEYSLKTNNVDEHSIGTKFLQHSNNMEVENSLRDKESHVSGLTRKKIPNFQIQKRSYREMKRIQVSDCDGFETDNFVLKYPNKKYENSRRNQEVSDIFVQSDTQRNNPAINETNIEYDHRVCDSHQSNEDIVSKGLKNTISNNKSVAYGNVTCNGSSDCDIDLDESGLNSKRCIQGNPRQLRKRILKDDKIAMPITTTKLKKTSK